MITYDNKQYRNLEEQVLKNKEDIHYLLNEGGTLNEFGLKVVGEVATAAELPDPATYTGEYGDAFVVGTATPFEFYIFTRAFSGEPTPFWFNIGEFPLAGPQGPAGPAGPQGPTGQGSRWLVGEAADPNQIGESGFKQYDMYLSATNGSVWQFMEEGPQPQWYQVTNITGPAGPQGIRGPQGPQGERGIQGQQGPVGPAGDPFTIAGTLTSSSQLPAPESVSRATAYLVTEDNVNYLYVITGEEGNLMWQNNGSFGGGSSVYQNGQFVQRFNVDTITQQIAETDQEVTTNKQILDSVVDDVQVNANNITALQQQTTLLNTNKADSNASNLSLADLQAWSKKLGIESLETQVIDFTYSSVTDWINLVNQLNSIIGRVKHGIFKLDSSIDAITPEYNSLIISKLDYSMATSENITKSYTNSTFAGEFIQEKNKSSTTGRQYVFKLSSEFNFIFGYNGSARQIGIGLESLPDIVFTDSGWEITPKSGITLTNAPNKHVKITLYLTPESENGETIAQEDQSAGKIFF